MNKKVFLGTAIGCLLGATVGYSAAVVSVPHTFTAGTPIKASEVNANFAALAQEITTLKNDLPFAKSSNFSEVTISPISAAVGSTVTIHSNVFVIKQTAGIEDPLTGKKYTLNYPQQTTSSSKPAIWIANCKAINYSNAITVGVGNGNGFTSYLMMAMHTPALPTDTGAGQSLVFLNIQITKNLCANAVAGGSTTDTSFTATSLLIDTVAELQKYISVQEI